jgi:hypothetical protein
MINKKDKLTKHGRKHLFPRQAWDTEGDPVSKNQNKDKLTNDQWPVSSISMLINLQK